MDDGSKSREDLLGEVEGLRRQLAAAERDCQIRIEALRAESALAEAEWRRRVEVLEAKGDKAPPPCACSHEETEVGEGDTERQRLLAMIQNQAEELQVANAELTVQTEELRIQNEELLAQTEILEEQKQSLQHQAEERDTEQALLKSILEQMPAGVVIAAAPAGPILLSNRLADQIWNERLQARADLETYWRVPREYPDGRLYRKEETPLWRSLTLGEVVMGEEMILRPQGGPRIYLSVSSAPVRDDQGRIVAGVVTHSDITARKAAEAEIKRLASFPQLNPNPVLEIDPAGAITYRNQATLAALDSLGEATRPEAFLPEDLADILIARRERGEGRFYREVRIKDVVFAEDISYAEPFKVFRIYARDITAHQAAEEALRESQKDLNRAQALALTGSWRLDMQRNALLWSDETYRMFGIPQGTPLTYEAFLAVVHPEDRMYVDQKWTAALGGEPYDIEHCIVVGDTVKWVREKAELEFDPQGRLLGGFGMVQDITERKAAELERLKLLERLQESQEELQVMNEDLLAQTEELQEANQDLLTAQIALRESEARFRGLFEHMTEGVALHEVIYDDQDTAVDYRIIDTNPAFTVHTGLQPEKIHGQLASTAYGAGEAPFLETYVRVAQTGQPAAFETFFPPLQRHLSISVASPQPGQFVTVFEDITTRKRMEEALRESREDLNRAQAIGKIGSWRMDVQRNELTWSDENYRIFGVPRGTPMTYEGFLAIVHPEDREFVDREWMASLRGEPYDIEHRIVVGDTVKWVREQAELEFDSQGQLLGGFGTTQDITTRKQAEKALRLSNQRLDLLAETAGLLLASASPQEVAEAICQRVMTFLDCDTCFNFLVDENEGRLRLNTFAGIPPEEAKRIEWLDYGTAVCGCAAQTGNRIVTENVQTTPDPRMELVKSYGIQAYACHPLLMEGRVLGTLSFGTRTRPRFSPDELSLMNAVADQVAVAMDRKRTEEAIIRAKEEWERTFDAVPDLIALMDQEHHITRINRAMAELLGKTQAEVIGKSCYNAVHGLEEAPDFCPLSQVVASGREHSTEVTEFGRIFAVSVSPTFSPDGQLLGGVHVARDITAHKQAEGALRHERDFVTALLETVGALVVVLDREGRIVRFNQACEQNTGYSSQEVEGKPFFDKLLLPEEVQGVKEVFKGLTGGDFPNSHVNHWVTRDGEARLISWSNSALTDEQGQMTYIIGTGIDITERHRAEEALKQAHDELEQRVKERTAELRDTVAQLIEEVQERQLAQESLRKQAELLELAHEAIIVTDLDFQVIFWNRGAAETYGWPRQQATGQVTHALLKTRFPTTRGEVDRALLQTGQWQGELVHTRADGEEIVVASRMALQRDNQGQPVAILEINRDVTARRRAEEALEAERQRLLALLERIPAHVALLRQDHSFAYVNGEFIRRFGDPGSKRCFEVVGQANPCEECQAMAVFQTWKPSVWEWTGPDGNIYQIYDYPFTDVDGAPLVLEMGVDITPRKRAEDQAFSLGRMYRMLSKVNEAIVRVTDKDELFRQICRLMMEEGNFLLAWIGLVDRETGLVKSAAQYNLNDDYLQNITIPLADVPEGRGPTGIAVRAGRYDFCNDIAADPRMAPWREQALARGFRSSAAFPLRVGASVVGVLTVYADRPGFFNADELALLGSLTDDLSFALDFQDRDAKRRQAEEALRESEERLRYLASRLLHAQENERRRLALELHDDLGQSLMVLKLQLRGIGKTVPAEQWKTQEECSHCLDYLSGVIDNVRRLARNLRPAVLEDLGLAAGLRVLTGEFRKYHEAELSLEMDDIEGLFSRDEEINIYRIFQETLTNIGKHAQARQVSIVIKRHADGVSFKVVDDGVGFDLKHVLARDPAKKGLGLAALEERVHMLGGTLQIRVRENQGTEISFTVPYRIAE